VGGTQFGRLERKLGTLINALPPPPTPHIPYMLFSKRFFVSLTNLPFFKPGFESNSIVLPFFLTAIGKMRTFLDFPQRNEEAEGE
jgi:hypothetical protein